MAFTMNWIVVAYLCFVRDYWAANILLDIVIHIDFGAI